MVLKPRYRESGATFKRRFTQPDPQDPTKRIPLDLTGVIFTWALAKGATKLTDQTEGIPSPIIINTDVEASHEVVIPPAILKTVPIGSYTFELNIVWSNGLGSVLQDTIEILDNLRQ